MNPAIERMLARYRRDTLDQSVHALREVLQEIVLLGLWRAKFFEHVAFYGGTALRILYGLDRFSEDLDFSLLSPDASFSLRKYASAIEREVEGFGFDLSFEAKGKQRESAIESAFLKGNTQKQLVVIETDPRMARAIHPAAKLKIRLEVDIDPPPEFSTDSVPVLQPIPFAVRAYSLPDMFAGKLHAVLFRTWRNRVKGRDWYDFVWYVANHPRLHLSHLEARMRQSGHFDGERLTAELLGEMLQQAIDVLDVAQVAAEVRPFLQDPMAIDIWSRDFFKSLIARIQMT